MDYLVQEAYYGKLPEFEEMEKLFTSLIEKAKKEGFKKCNPNNYPEQKKICKLFCKLFGFKKSLIYWEPYKQGNAFTYSMNAFIIYSDKKKFVNKTERGFYDSSNSTVLTVFITTGLLELGLTARQMIAIILHEIGHNFDYSSYHKFDVFLSNIMSFGMAKKEINKYKDKLDDVKIDIYNDIKKEDDKLYNNQKRRDRVNDNWFKNMKVIVKMNAIFVAVTAPLHALCDIVYASFIPVWNAFNLAGKKGELFADSFATAYGYGEELISSLKILGDTKIFYSPKSPIMKFFMDLSTLQSEIIISIVDVHGTDMERCQECIEKLKWDLKNNDFSPELKEELIEEINKMTRAYKSFYKFDKDDQYKITKVARKVCNILFKGKPNIQKFFARHKV